MAGIAGLDGGDLFCRPRERLGASVSQHSNDTLANLCSLDKSVAGRRSHASRVNAFPAVGSGQRTRLWYSMRLHYAA